jgi:benzoate-CoA ligase
MQLRAFNAAVKLLRENVEFRPDKVAYFCGNSALSYGELDKRSRQFARFLQDQGIVPGERVLIVLPDCFAFPIVFLGCLLAGAVAVAADTGVRKDDFAHIIRDSGARMLVYHADSAVPCSVIGEGVKVIVFGDDGPAKDSIGSDDFVSPYQPSGDDIAYMLYSSGSTGRPKGVPHRHRSLLLPCDLVGKAVLGIKGDDVIFSTSKLSFAYGLLNSLAFPLRFGATSVLHPGKPDPLAIHDIIELRRPSVFFSVPTTYARIILSRTEQELKLPMRLCCSAGEALPAALFEEWGRLTGLEIIDGIGSTEMAYHFICNIPGQAVAGSAGRLVPGYRARLVDEDGNDVPMGSEGNLLVSGDTRCPFYWNLPEQSAETMLAEGFARTGDIFVERDGYYYYRGRSDDMIKTDAHWVSPLIVEDALRGHPAVADCAVAPVSVGTLIKPAAFVVVTPGTDRTASLARALAARVKARLPDYMCPVRFRFLDDLPRTPTGKVQRFRLREVISNPP